MNYHGSEACRPGRLATLVMLSIAASACQPEQDERGTGQQEEEAADVERTAGRPDDRGAGQQAQPGQAGTFDAQRRPGGPTGDEQGRMPADADLTMRIAATDLFPGAARLDPNIRNPYSGDPQAISAGERHFAAFNCGGCHAPLGGGGMGPPLSDDAWIYGSQPAQIYLSIMHGRPEGMPSWSSMLPRQTAWELVAYIETLDEIDDYAAEKGFDSNRQQAGQATGEAGADEPQTRQ